MKIYNTKNGKAVYINNEQVIISEETAKVIENFESKVDDLNNKTYKSSSDAQILEFANKYHVEEINKEKQGIKIECKVLFEGEKIQDMKILRNGVDVSSQINESVFQQSYENIINF